MMQGYAGPVQQGDMVVRANEVSPGITALLSKQNRKGAQGIYELPSAQQPTPNYYNMALDNVQNEIRSAARMVNAMAPEGERLAYINPEEEGILKLLGGSGEPQPVTGIPSYYITQKEKESGKTAQRSMRSFARSRDNDNKKSVTQMSAQELQDIVNKAYQDTGVAISDTGQIKFASDPDLYKGGGYRYGDKSDGGKDEFASGTLGESQKSALDKYIEKDIPLKDDALMKTLQAGKLYGDKGFFTSDYNKRLQKSLAAMGLGGENIFGTYLTPEGRDYYQALGGGSSKAGDIAEKISDFGIFGLLKNLFGGDPEELSIKDRLERAQRAREALENQQRRGDGGSQPIPEEPIDETEEEEEEELPYFSYYRRFRQPMTYEDIIRRAYEGSDGPLLETIQEAMDRNTT
jgi:hypothetical protein